ncbi:DUF3379 domain-containing protein [Thalassotalea euphylliae]|uniref:DUF3379 domain-containing protein n=1 Tax=Thalassotalea euphylliae TaxID=1655234 RepID=A0A3E0TP81_9GAMM|nr:DUF3379 family protein [Thalassotalea euphylliae]REL26157.1 DUF3379 domain-containing protein [Thalassotalea euphylliae]
MDDLQFRRHLYAAPNSQDPEFLAAKQADESRAQFAQEIEELDSKIAQALKVPVPEDLSNKLILRQAMASHQQQKRKSRIHLALAASVAFAVGLTVNMLQFSSAYNNVGDYAMAHVYYEQDNFSNDMPANITLASLNNKMSTFDGNFIDMIGQLIAADYCRFDGIKSLHLVFQGESSPVNVFIVPERDEVAFAEAFSDEKLNGKSFKHGKNQVIVVGDKTESLNQWKENINKNIQWSI